MRDDYLEPTTENMSEVEQEIELICVPFPSTTSPGQSGSIANLQVFVLAAKKRQEAFRPSPVTWATGLR